MLFFCTWNAQSQVLRNSEKCIQSRSIDRCHALSFSCPQSMTTKKPLRLLLEDTIEMVTCGKRDSKFLRFSWLRLYMSESIRVLESRTKRVPPVRLRSRFFERNLMRADAAWVEATGMPILSYVQAATTTHL